MYPHPKCEYKYCILISITYIVIGMAIQALVHLSESRSPCPLVSFNGGCGDDILQSVFLLHIFEGQSVTSRLETSRYRDFSQFFESIGLGLENI